MAFDQTVNTGNDPNLYLHIWSSDNKTFNYHIGYKVTGGFNTEAQSYLHLYLNGNCILTSNPFWVYNYGAREVAWRDGTFDCSGLGNVYADVTCNVGGNTARWNLKTPTITVNPHIYPGKPSTTITCGNTTFSSNGTEKKKSARFFLYSSGTTFNTLNIKRSATNVSTIKTEVWRNGSLLSTKTGDFSITFTAADKNSVYELCTTAISSTNDTNKAETLKLFIDVAGNIYDNSSSGNKLVVLYKMLKG